MLCGMSGACMRGGFATTLFSASSGPRGYKNDYVPGVGAAV